MKYFNLIRLTALCLCIILLFPTLHQGQTLDKTTKKQLKGFDAFVEKEMKRWNVPGLSVAIVKDGKVILTKGYGYADVANKRQATEKTLFAIGSSSKAFTATSVMALVDEEKVALDKPVKTYLPDFKLFNEELTKNLTVRDLLTHRSGLPRHDLAWYGSSADRKTLYKRLEYLEPTEPLRQTWQYQNLMYMTAGYLAGELSNSTWEQVVQERIFNPLKMTASNFSVDKMQKATDYALPYTEDKTEQIEKMDFRNIDNIGPAGSINSNAVDMANWLIMLLNKGTYEQEEILSEGSLNEMLKPQMIIPGNMTKKEIFYSSYGLGWMITSYRGHLRVDHGGNIDGFTASVCVMPNDDFGVVVLTNKNRTNLTSVIRNNVIDRLNDLEIKDWSSELLESIEKIKTATKDEEEPDDLIQKKGTSPSKKLKNYVGKYDNKGYGITTISMKEDTLHLQLNGLEFDLDHYHYDVFYNKEIFGGIKVQFIMNLNGDIVGVQSKLEPSLDKFIVFDKMPETVALTVEDLAKYVGEYVLMGQDLKFEIKGDNLTATVPGQPTYTLIPSTEHKFNLKGLDGYAVLFAVKDGKASAVTFMQPNGNFTAKRK